MITAVKPTNGSAKTDSQAHDYYYEFCLKSENRDVGKVRIEDDRIELQASAGRREGSLKLELKRGKDSHDLTYSMPDMLLLMRPMPLLKQETNAFFSKLSELDLNSTLVSEKDARTVKEMASSLAARAATWLSEKGSVYAVAGKIKLAIDASEVDSELKKGETKGSRLRNVFRKISV